MANVKKKKPQRQPSALNELERRLFLKYYIENDRDGTAAYLKLRPKVTKGSASTLASRLLAKVEFDDLLDAAGVTDEAIAKGLGEGMQAVRTISATVIIKSDDPTVKTKQANARTVDFIDVPDFQTRHKYIETAARMRKRLIDRVALGTGEDGEEPIAFVVAKVPVPEAHKPNAK